MLLSLKILNFHCYCQFTATALVNGEVQNHGTGGIHSDTDDSLQPLFTSSPYRLVKDVGSIPQPR
jgi:hypothetical protein